MAFKYSHLFLSSTVIHKKIHVTECPWVDSMKLSILDAIIDHEMTLKVEQCFPTVLLYLLSISPIDHQLTIKKTKENFVFFSFD